MSKTMKIFESFTSFTINKIVYIDKNCEYKLNYRDEHIQSEIYVTAKINTDKLNPDTWIHVR